jgi:hypothetical protein
VFDLSGFVVTAEDGDSMGVSNFERNEESDCLDGVVPAIDVIAHEAYHTRAQCATFSGPIRMIVVDGESHHVVLDTLSDRIYLKPSITQTG